MYDLFFAVCAKITLIRQQRTRTNIAPNPPYSMLTLGGGSPTNGNERLFHNGTTPPMRANIELGVEGGGVCMCERFVDERYFQSHRTRDN